MSFITLIEDFPQYEMLIRLYMYKGEFVDIPFLKSEMNNAFEMKMQ